MNNISFEFFPPNTPEGDVKLRAVTQQLMLLKPKYFSVTYGAGGATREKTLSTVKAVAEAGNDVAPHLSCVGATKASVMELLNTYRSQGINRLVALGGEVGVVRLVSGPIETETHEGHHADEHTVELVETPVSTQESVGGFVKTHRRAVHEMAYHQHQRQGEPP